MCSPRVLIRWKDDIAQVLIVRCKSWECSDCRPRKLRRLRQLANSGCPTTFITLTTTPHQYDSPAERAKQAVLAFRKLVQAIRRRHGQNSFHYLYVLEETKRGEPHLHIIARAPYIDQKWLSSEWLRVSGAKIVDIRRCRTARGAAIYITKYIAKKPAQFGDIRRFNKSQKWVLAKADDPPHIDWAGAEIRELHNVDPAMLCVLFNQSWRQVSELNCEAYWTRFKGTDPPPLWRAATELPRRRSPA